MKFQRLRGTHDVLGDEARRFDAVYRSARQVFGAFGYEEIQTPILEEKEVFTRALGDQTDVVQKEMYEFKDRSGGLVAMRPEGTAGVVRAYIENHLDKTQGLAKLFYAGPMFRSERPQAGRLRQFHQVGVETLGTADPLSDAETIHALKAFLDATGVSGYTVKLNNLGDFKEREAFGKVLRAFFEPQTNALCEDCQKRLSKNVFRILDCKVAECRAVAKKAPLIQEHLGAASKEHFEKVKRGLDWVGVSYQVDPHQVRGLDYYTKTVFEVSHPSLGAQDALAAGGRYDSLIEAFGGAPAGAVGFAIGVERLLMCLGDTKTDENERKASIFIATLGEAALEAGFKLASKLRAHGVKALMDVSAKSLKSQMRSADKERCGFVAILGDDELKNKTIMLKNLANGEQAPVALGDAVKELQKKVFDA